MRLPGFSSWQTPTLPTNLFAMLPVSMGFPGGSVLKNWLANAGYVVRSLGQEIPWRRKWQPSPVVLPEKSHGQRSLAGYSPWGCRVRHG